MLMLIRSIGSVLVLVMWLGGAAAADKVGTSSDEAFAAGKSAEIETLKARASLNPSLGATPVLMEADDLLRRFRQAKPGEKATIRAQLDATLARAELELARGK